MDMRNNERAEAFRTLAIAAEENGDQEEAEKLEAQAQEEWGRD